MLDCRQVGTRQINRSRSSTHVDIFNEISFLSITLIARSGIQHTYQTSTIYADSFVFFFSVWFGLVWSCHMFVVTSVLTEKIFCAIYLCLYMTFNGMHIVHCTRKKAVIICVDVRRLHPIKFDMRMRHTRQQHDTDAAYFISNSSVNITSIGDRFFDEHKMLIITH